MSTFNLNIEDCNKNQFPIDLIFIGNEIYKDIIKIAKTSAGIIILIPFGIASFILLPVTYIVLTVVLTYYLFRINYLTTKLLAVVATRDNYKDLYEFFIFSNKSISKLEIIESTSNKRYKGLFIKPVLFFIKRFHSNILKANHHLESQLFEIHNPSDIPIEDINYFRSQRLLSDDDWNDDELWKDFQIKHHHLAN